MIAFWGAAAVAVVVTGALIMVLHKARVMDVPNGRSSHVVPTPRGGGIAVMLAVVTGLALAGTIPWWVLAPSLLLSCVGLMDDVRSLPALFRLVAQVGVLACAVFFLLDDGAKAFGLVALVGVIAAVGYVNAFNFMDGVNGISALHAAVAGGWFVWVGSRYDVDVVGPVGAALAGAVLGFLFWNARGSIFLGDVGSYGMGALIALSSVFAWGAGVPALVVVAPLGVYLSDTAWVLVKRKRAGKSLTEAHRDHVYQRLLGFGWSHLVSAAWSASIAALGCVSVALLVDGNPVLAALVLAALLVLYLASPQLVQRTVLARKQAA
ncbi:MraY family glycosyltransferase [Nocardioides yefusunii]|uniref:Glycosyltransferase family 4 protein n=1 Tax=Nocardioides yefusunii TaxID=2500546 RepID=A0ABW1QWH6_9ACTN|nr:glycosyltransferase family 4 protein [Nocardioides yefusunii]